MQYPDVMVDLETTGTNPTQTSIIQLAAVRFNLAEGTVDPVIFNRCMAPSSTRFWEESTREWWAGRQDQLAKIYAQMKPPALVMREFSTWAGREGGAMWAKPTSFDYPFLASYCNEFEVSMPYHFRNSMDVNTFIRSRHFPVAPPEYAKDIPFEGDEHDAIMDCFHQLKCVFAAYEATK